MKDSRIPWLGEIPKTWSLIMVKQLFSITRGRVIAKTEIIDGGKYPIYSSQTKDNGCMGYINTYDYEGAKLTWTTDGANAGTVFLREGKYNCTNVCGVLTPNTLNNNMQYLKYMLEYTAIFHKRYDINGFKIMSNEMADIIISLPDLNEQHAIADFLDSQCEKIDRLITLQEELIEELKAYKQSVITEAVTKGLDPTVPMKDSGIEWIGEIPKEWNVILLSSLFDQRKNKNIGMEETNLLSLSYGRVIKKNIETKEGLLPESFESYNIIFPGDIVFRLIDLQNDKHSLRTGLCAEKGIITSAYVTIMPKSNINSFYMQSLLHSYDICKVYYGLGDGVRQGMNFSDLKKVLILLPPISQQKQIAYYLDKKCADIDKLITIKQCKIDELKEYKKSLIYEYVTGKKEVAYD